MNYEQTIQALEKLHENIMELAKQMREGHMPQQTPIPEHLKNANNNDLIKAIEDGRIDDIKIMVTMPIIDPNIALRSAVNTLKNFELTKWLMQNPRVDPSHSNNVALVDALYYDQNDIAKLLFTNEHVKNGSLDTAIEVAYLKENKEMIKIFRENGVDMKNGLNKAIISCTTKNTDFLKYLLNEPEADPTYNNFEALKHYLDMGYTQRSALLVNHPKFVKTN